MDKKEFVKTLRKELKRVYPNCKFSIHESFGIMNILLLSSYINPFSDGKIRKILMKSYFGLNIDTNGYLNDFSKGLFRYIKSYMDVNYKDIYAVGIGTDCTNFHMGK